MHWLPLVAMVIASALPFPHSPVSKIATATAKPGFDKRRAHRHDPAARLAAAPVDYSFNGSASQTDYNMTAALSQHTNRQNLQRHKDYVKSSVHEETFKVESRGTYQSNSNSGSDDRGGPHVPTKRVTLRAEDVSQDTSLSKDYKPGSTSRHEYSGFVDFSKKDNLPNSSDRPLQVSALKNQENVSPDTSLKGQRGPKLTAPSDQLRDRPAVETGSQRTVGTGRGFPEESLTVEAGLGLGAGLDTILKGDEMFLDAHPRVLFSSSSSPPEHPPLLLMLETGLLGEGGDGEEQEDMDEHIEGHGDRALDRGTTLSWADSSRATSEDVRPVKRDKRSHLSDSLKEIRTRERSVCESKSSWVDKIHATDIHGQNLTVLQEIQTQAGPLKQYFYETVCRSAESSISAGKSKGVAAKPPGTGVAGGGCLGVDKKQWHSECKAKQSYVRALTKDSNNKIGWRWIRIDSSCVCVLLSRAKQATGREILTRRGRA
ncbi:uncharacterized protein ntf4 [Archocentrus centrarchus]|uniref:uncharacterized protein ntf4 n=1 Tax=Archocentrus centrarchus TaxID=63155 RepID=UPI0011EA3706|nr:uncharacterized protein LOC115784873 [Archocentrus centrarchus]